MFSRSSITRTTSGAAFCECQAVEQRRRHRRRRRRLLPLLPPPPSLSPHVLATLPEDLSRHGGPDRLLHRARKIVRASVSRGETRHLSTSASFTDTHTGAGSQSTILTHVTVPRINTLHAHAFVPSSFLPFVLSFLLPFALSPSEKARLLRTAE